MNGLLKRGGGGMGGGRSQLPHPGDARGRGSVRVGRPGGRPSDQEGTLQCPRTRVSGLVPTHSATLYMVGEVAVHLSIWMYVCMHVVIFV